MTCRLVAWTGLVTVVVVGDVVVEGIVVEAARFIGGDTVVEGVVADAV